MLLLIQRPEDAQATKIPVTEKLCRLFYETKSRRFVRRNTQNRTRLWQHRVISEWPLDGQSFRLIRGNNIGTLSLLRVEKRESSRDTAQSHVHARRALLREQSPSKVWKTLTFLLSLESPVVYRIVIKLALFPDV